ncbi:hypothetical protein [Nigerium massiliense]|uniref:hypothetical protein n=1 Tax=Nigerium massiliense TaxID=1522317 RepID=UPI0005907F17|nr:hypothetical protein [Nigerium massiliense]
MFRSHVAAALAAFLLITPSLAAPASPQRETRPAVHTAGFVAGTDRALRAGREDPDKFYCAFEIFRLMGACR